MVSDFLRTELSLVDSGLRVRVFGLDAGEYGESVIPWSSLLKLEDGGDIFDLSIRFEELGRAIDSFRSSFECRGSGGVVLPYRRVPDVPVWER